MQDVERQLKVLLRSVDADTLAADEKKAVVSIRRLSADARLDVRDYELSETRAEQLQKAAIAKKRIAKLRAAILIASMSFGPADVAQIDAQLDQIMGRLV